MEKMNFDILHGESNPRNSEGAFIRLSDGRIKLIYTRYNGKDGIDDSSAEIVERVSTDGGRNWSDYQVTVRNTAKNVMSVSLLRLQDGRIAMVYAKKSAIPGHTQIDCRPYIRFSEDETESWSEPVDIAGIPSVYLVVNNDRLIQLKNGRLIVPAAWHRYTTGTVTLHAIGLFFLSDDGGYTWRQSSECCYPPQAMQSGLQEPGVIELSDGRIMSWFRTSRWMQYKAFSYDGGETWTQPEPAEEFPSWCCSPLSMKRNPDTKELFSVWNEIHPQRCIRIDEGERTPLVLARSTDDGKTWTGHIVMEDSPLHGFCYTAMLFNKSELLLEYCCGSSRSGQLNDSRIRVIPLSQI